MKGKTLDVWIPEQIFLNGNEMMEFSLKEIPNASKAKLIVKDKEPEKLLTPSMIIEAYSSRECTNLGVQGMIKKLFGDK